MILSLSLLVFVFFWGCTVGARIIIEEMASAQYWYSAMRLLMRGSLLVSIILIIIIVLTGGKIGIL
jgi:hypothetical protein